MSPTPIYKKFQGGAVVFSVRCCPNRRLPTTPSYSRCRSHGLILADHISRKTLYRAKRGLHLLNSLTEYREAGINTYLFFTTLLAVAMCVGRFFLSYKESVAGWRVRNLKHQ